MKKYIRMIAALAAITFAPIALAAVPDGNGPWADSVIESSQGTNKDGSAVLASRSDPATTVGAAESTGVPMDPVAATSTFFSLGFGGSITLGFTNSIINGPGNDLQVYEVTTGTYIDEKVKVEASPDGTAWTTVAAVVNRDGGVDLGSLKCAQYVRLTDVTNPADFEATADGYDVDAIKALHTSTLSCDPEHWKGEVHSQGYWKNHDAPVTSWNGMTNGPVKGNPCQALANQAIAFLNNWELNASYQGTTFQNSDFSLTGHAWQVNDKIIDGKSMEEIHEIVTSIECSAPKVQLLALQGTLDLINNGKGIWY